MTISSGSSINRTGLVFHFDMENNGKSWRGQPVTNLWANQANVSDLNSFNGWQMPGVPGATSVITTDYGTWNSATKSSIWKVTVGTGTMQSYASWRLCLDTGLSALGSTRRLQAKVKMLRGSITNLGFHDGGGTGGYTYTAIDPADIPGGVSDKTGWYLLSRQSNWTSTSVGQCIGIGILAQDIEFLVAEPMIALGATSTVPYTPNARSNTEAILDLTGNNTITANSLTYNSDGTFSFNGSNTYASFSNPISENGPYTVIQWLKPSTVLSSGGSGANKPVGTNRRTSIVGPGPVWNPGIWVTSDYIRVHAKTQHLDAAINWTTTDWKMIGMTYDGTNCQIIFNGEFLPIAFTTSISFATATTMYLGAETTAGSGVNWLGNIGATQMYNKVLTATEVKQNFEASRGRYGI